MAVTFQAAGTEAAGSGTTVAPGVPASPATDDVFLELVHCSDISGGTLSGPSPWHQLANFGGTGRMGVWWVRRDESNPGTTVTSSADPAGTIIGGIAGFRGVLKGGYPFSAVGGTSTGTDSSIEHTGITPLHDNCMLVLLNGSHDDVSRTLVTDWTNILDDGGGINIFGDATGTPDASCHMSYLLQTSAAATGTVTQTQGAAVGWGSILVALRPEPAAKSDVNFVWQVDGGASVTLRADIADDDFVVVQIFRDGSNSEPGAINGDASWDAYLVANAASDSSSYKLYARVLGTGEAAALVSATLTSTSATQMHVGVWRPETGYTLSVGGIGTSAAGSGTDFPFPTLTFSIGDGTSHVIAGGMHRSANGSPWLEPSGFINRGFVRTTTARVVFHESDGGLASWAGETVAIGATSSQRRCWSIEMVVTAPAGAGAPRANLMLLGAGF